MIDNVDSKLSRLIGTRRLSAISFSFHALCIRVQSDRRYFAESGCFSKGATPSTIDNQFPSHIRARTPISQGSSPSLRTWKPKASDHPASHAPARARTHEIFLSIWQFSRAKRDNHRARPLSFSRRINPCDERPLEKFEVSWWNQDPSEAVQLKRFIGQGGRGRPIYSQGARAVRSSLENRWREEKGRRLTSGEKDAVVLVVVVVVVGGNRYRFLARGWL